MSAEKVPDQLRFRGGVAGAETMVPWQGAWPPPQRIALAIGRETGLAAAFDPEQLPEKGLTLEQVARAANVGIYRLRNASQLPDTFADPHAFRGADYTPEQDEETP